MPATIVVGGQFGSEGKGKVVALISSSRPVSCVVRCGGPNSGHTTVIDSKEVVLRQLPSSVCVSDSLVAISAGAVIDPIVLENEIRLSGVSPDRLVIDPRAVLITEEDRKLEASLVQSIGSTGSGNGQALIRRMLRTGSTLAGDSPSIAKLGRVEPVAPLIHSLLAANREVIVEGTQGFGLSLLHGPHFPFVTSKDTTAAAFAAEVGISPRDIGQIVMVIRTFPIRVGGASGPLAGELNWKDLQEIAGASCTEPELTSVTRTVRRVAVFDIELVRSAVNYNRPTSLAVMGIDRLDCRNRGASHISELTNSATDFLSMLKCELGIPIEWIGTGFKTFEAISTNGSFVQEVADVG